MEIWLPIENLPLFIPAALLLILTPGPVVLYIVTLSMNRGRKAGLISVLGTVIGNFCHVVAAALGLSALLVSSPLAFNIVKYLGAAYLIYLGIQKLRSQDVLEEQKTRPETPWQIFVQGIVVAILNPKTALFFFAFLPQFADPTRGAMGVQILFLGTVLVFMASIVNGLFGVMAGTAGGWLRHSSTYLRVQRYVAAAMYIGLGIVAALATTQPK